MFSLTLAADSGKDEIDRSEQREMGKKTKQTKQIEIEFCARAERAHLATN